jgi:sugar transferase (PEP-CTERM/EpsH1 system associated)
VTGHAARSGTVPAVRVMHVVHGLRPGGMEYGVVKIVNALAASRVASSICSTVPSASMRELVDAAVPVFEFARRDGNDPRIVWQLYRLCRRERPDILHTHAWGTLIEGLVAGRLARVPVIVHGEHGTLQLQPRQVAAQRWAWNRADQLLAVSSRLAERMAREVGVPLDRVRVIRNGVDLTRFGGARPQSARAALGVPDDGAVVIGAVGRLVDVKDHARLIDAIGILTTRGHRVHGVIAGDGPLRADLETRIARQGLAGIVRLLGHRPDVEAVFAGLDVFVQCSKSEGMSNTILEAMATGLPVVATHVGGADEMILDGTTGLLVPAEDAAQLAGALERLVVDAPLRRGMAAAGRARAHDEFSLAHMIASYQSFYSELVQRRGASAQPSLPRHRTEGL